MTVTREQALEAIPVQHRPLVLGGLKRLSEEFQGVYGPETVERFVFESLYDLRNSRVKDFLPLFTERFARDRLWALGKSEGKIESDLPVVLFLCVQNAGRSQMAAGWLERLAEGRVKVMSGGSAPGELINPNVARAMAEAGIDIGQQFPKPWTDEIVRSADVVVTMGCGDACPIFPGKRYEDWDVTDPAELDLDAVRQIRDQMQRRVVALMKSIGMQPAALPSSPEPVGS